MPPRNEILHRSLKVLIVEDESRLRDLLLDVVPDLGFPAAAARSAEEGLRLMESDASDIVILDLHLPLMGGMDFFQVVRQRWPETEVIVLSGYGDIESARKAIHLDVVEFLAKPCHLKDVELALDRARQRHSARRPEAQTAEPLDAAAVPAPEAAGQTLAEIEKRQILAALARNNGNRAATAAELGISRRTLYYKLDEYRDDGG